MPRIWLEQGPSRTLAGATTSATFIVLALRGDYDAAYRALRRMVALGEARGYTRRQIERNLHDGAQQRLVTLTLQLRTAKAAIPPQLDTLRAQLDGAITEANGVLKDLQEIAGGPHPAILAKGGLDQALRVLARRSPIPVQLSISVPRTLSQHVEISAYYIVAEALTNIAKHARATAAAVTVDIAGESVRAEVRDDGAGGANFADGTGLLGLKDRIEAFGGRLFLHSVSGEGTSLRAEPPSSPRTMDRLQARHSPGTQLAARRLVTTAEPSMTPSAVSNRTCWSWRGRSTLQTRPAVAVSGWCSRRTGTMSLVSAAVPGPGSPGAPVTCRGPVSTAVGRARRGREGERHGQRPPERRIDELESRVGGPKRRQPGRVCPGPDAARPVDDVHAGQLVQAHDPAACRRVQGRDPHLGFEGSEVHDVEGCGQGLVDRGQPAEPGVRLALQERRELSVERCLQPRDGDVGGRGGPPQPRGGFDRECLRQIRGKDDPQAWPPDTRRLPGPAHSVIDLGQDGPGLLE